MKVDTGRLHVYINPQRIGFVCAGSHWLKVGIDGEMWAFKMISEEYAKRLAFLLYDEATNGGSHISWMEVRTWFDGEIILQDRYER